MFIIGVSASNDDDCSGCSYLQQQLDFATTEKDNLQVIIDGQRRTLASQNDQLKKAKKIKTEEQKGEGEANEVDDLKKKVRSLESRLKKMTRRKNQMGNDYLVFQKRIVKDLAKMKDLFPKRKASSALQEESEEEAGQK